MSIGMRLYQLLERVDVLSVCRDCEITSIVSDSRKICPGDLFVAISGIHFDGHNACGEVLEKGAAAVIVERDLGLPHQVIVSDSRTALNKLIAAYYEYPSEEYKLIGVTGTSGKTSTTFMVKAMLDRLGKKTGLIGTVKCMAGSREFPADQTTPEPEELQRLFKLMAVEGCEYVVMEVSSQGIAQGRIDGCRFEAAAFTNFSQDHLDYHGSMQAYLNAKKPLFALAKSAVSNADDPKGAEGVELFTGKPLFISVRGKGVLNASNIECDIKGTRFDLEYNGEKRHISVPILGNFTVYNAMTAAALLMQCGFGFDEVCRAFSSVTTVPGRLELIPTCRDFTILLDYAHKPDALEKVLKTVRSFSTGRVVVLFGCGGDRDKLKRPLMGKIAEELADFVYVTSDNPRHEAPDAIIGEILEGMKQPKKRRVISDRREAIKTAILEHQPGDVVILAGKGHEAYQKIGDSVLHFDEREITAQFLSLL
ncbi:MAG TPA: UDP-N-acetylmuramoyl-L-alanyl-D-glutamate--2,6-diaminopimelate ligase [Oscillospiraceae bacterium]|nr:UDP-N-acetylmuramoyl-L-alanyl-D-glutamate--2,6-diaminopimelate ligase [Oscillospiraceae bacterium]HPS35412.1 UDP-N-acetylmuramoyl-L-alanyl-D-glutamate--2,6-diaminopimelate ligase [Oscillospiraceae bacterium]